MTMSIGIFISGTGTNMASILRWHEAGDFSAVSNIAYVLSDRSDVVGLRTARDHGVRTVTVLHERGMQRDEYARLLLEAVAPYNTDLIVLAGFMRILSPVFIRGFPGRIVNVHPSLLPSFSGMNAQRQAFEAGVKVSGCTTHFVDETLDGGPVILQKAVARHNDDTLESFSERILREEHRLLPETIEAVTTGNTTEIDGYIKVERPS